MGAPLKEATVFGDGETETMQKPIHVVPASITTGLFARTAAGEFGHYPSLDAAKTVGQKLARKRSTELLVHGQAGKVHRSRPRKAWLSRLLGR
jgi:hypothetical protein